MEKKLKKWGEGLGIYFGKEEIGIYDFKEGEILDLSDIVKKRKKEVKGGQNGIKRNNKRA